jgi:RimJ/RimL family protein N-acetyltransferase
VNRWTLPSIMRRVVEISREDGPLVLFWKVLGETVFRRLRCFERSLWDPIPPASPIPGVTVGELPAERWGELQQVRPEMSLEEIARRVRRGERCFIASARGRIVHVRWVSFEKAWCEELGAEIPLAPNAAFPHKSFTTPEMRRCGLATEVSKFCLQSLRQAGFQRMVAVVDAENQAGLRAVEKAGYHPAGWLAVLRLGPWRHLIRWNGPRSHANEGQALAAAGEDADKTSGPASAPVAGRR